MIMKYKNKLVAAEVLAVLVTIGLFATVYFALTNAFN